MASLNSVGNSSKSGDFFKDCVTDKVRAYKPTLKGRTEFRIVPEIRADGSIAPMVLGTNPDGGLDISNLRIETLVNGLGTSDKVTGFSRVADRPDRDRTVAQPLAAFYIKMKKLMKDNKLEGQLFIDFTKATMKPQGKPAAIERPAEVGLLQVILVDWPKRQAADKLRPKHVIMLPTTAARAVEALLAKAWNENKQDIFAPASGMTIVLTERPGSDGKAYDAAFGQPMPLSEAQCKALWVPWQDALKFRTLAEQMQALVRCVGYTMVEHVLHDELEECGMLRGIPVSGAPAGTVAHVPPQTQQVQQHVQQQVQQRSPVTTALTLDSTDLPADDLPGDDVPDVPAPQSTTPPRRSLNDADKLAADLASQLGANL